jgi:alpha,alpha-trehalase
VSTLSIESGVALQWHYRNPEVFIAMLNQKLNVTRALNLEVVEELIYALDPCELKLDEMIEAEPEPEMIEGLPASDALTPADRYLELFEHVQTSHIFADSKTFPDCAPKMDPLDILIRYRRTRRQPGFTLRQFIEEHFWLPETHNSDYISDPSRSLKEHIDNLWPVLTREPQDHIPWSSLLALPQAYIVPGGRFSETYYWDSYFTMLGLAESGRGDLMRCIADNFAWMIEKYGHIPNGNRTYYLGRSQPPVFALMVELFEEDGVRGARRYLDHLRQEYAYWMDGAQSLLLNQAYRHTVRMPDGSLLNRYWDDRDTPRDEAWREDVETARHSGRPANEVYRDLRAGAASGWDYSSRWLRDCSRLASIRTTQFIPVDLNAFLYKLESTIANISALRGDKYGQELFRQKARARRQAMTRYLWDEESGCYRDYDWRRQALGLFSAASMVPLYVELATPEQAARVAEAVRTRLLTPGGVLATEYETGEQWDKPNGWAPLQWMTIQGLKRYGHDALGDDIAHRWLNTVNQVYQKQHKLVEKYHITNNTACEGGGGEYPLQDGFGWTNGVVRRLIGLYGEP